jgi:hypothetical protein
MNKFTLLLTAALSLTCGAAMAGFTAVTGVDAVSTPDANPNFIADPGEVFATIGSGSIVSYVPDTLSDPQLWGNDIYMYRYTLEGSAISVNGPDVVYGGQYLIFYDSDRSLTYNPGDFYVSKGDFTINARFGQTGQATLEGLLTQTVGPETLPFRDLSYEGPVSYIGTYTPVVYGQGTENYGVIQGTLRSPAIPEPASAALLLTGALPMAMRIRRRSTR